MDKRVIVLHSGGVDSTTLLYHYVRQGCEPISLTICYGQKHKKEIECARKTSKIFQVKHLEIEIPLPFSNSALLNSSIEVPKSDYTVETQKITVVPNRNMILLAYAIGFAEDLKCGYVAYAAHHNDRAVYPDCREEFFYALNVASMLGTYQNVKIEAPFISWTKGEIVRYGVSLGVPYEYTWSCYEGGEKPCGQCGTCHERRQAFEFAGVPDPLEIKHRRS